MSKIQYQNAKAKRSGKTQPVIEKMKDTKRNEDTQTTVTKTQCLEVKRSDLNAIAKHSLSKQIAEVKTQGSLVKTQSLAFKLWNTSRNHTSLSKPNR